MAPWVVTLLLVGCDPAQRLVGASTAVWRGEAWRYADHGSELIEVRLLDGRGRPLMHRELRYGDRVTRMTYGSDGTVTKTYPHGTTVQRFDDDRLIEEVVSQDDGLEWRTTHRYDTSGRRVYSTHVAPTHQWTETSEWDGDLRISRVRRRLDGTVDEIAEAERRDGVEVSTLWIDGMGAPFVFTSALDVEGRKVEEVADMGRAGASHTSRRYDGGGIREELEDSFQRSDLFTFDSAGRPEGEWTVFDDGRDEVVEWSWWRVDSPRRLR